MSDWEYASPHVVTVAVQPADIDADEHVNNSVYLTWFDAAAWSHSAALGMPVARCVALRRGMAARRTEIDYLRAAVLGDEVQIGTWIVATDRRLRVTRHFQICRAAERETLARATTEYVCLNLDTGRATRMPPEFLAAYHADLEHAS